jgi:signal transduction histidine kinase/ligand-binding sensor domain-containing protein
MKKTSISMATSSYTGIISRNITAVLILASSISFGQFSTDNLAQYTEMDGLPGAHVSNLISDRFGYIWTGTINGLARFDGYEFKRFYTNPVDSASIQGLVVWSLFEDSKGLIWIGSGPSYLNTYNPETRAFRQYAFKHLISHPANVELGVTSMCEDNNGRIYYGISTNYFEPISQALLYKDAVDDTLKRFLFPDSLVMQNVYGITKDKSGNIWLLSYSGVFKIDTSGKLAKFHSPAEETFKKNGEFPSDLKFDHNGQMWIISDKARLYEFNADYTSYKIHTSPDIVSYNSFANVIELDKSDNIWLGTINGLERFDRASGKFRAFSKGAKKHLEKTAITDLCFDSFGTLWIGTVMEGLLKFEERPAFKSFSSNNEDKNSITPGWANIIYETHDGKIWITTSGPANNAGMNELDPESGIIRPIPLRYLLPGSYIVYGLYENDSGDFVLSTNTGNYQFSPKTKGIKKIALKGVPDNIPINKFYKDSRGNLWLCTSAGLFKRNKGTGVFKNYDLSRIPGNNESSNEISAAYESKKHGLWLTTNNGLFLYNYKTDEIERLAYDKSKGDILLTQDVNSFYEDPEGIAWIGTWQGGLARYDPESGTLKNFTRSDGLPSMSIQAILPDPKHEALWLSTFEGLSRLELKTMRFINFSIADGIQGQLFADGSALKTSRGLFAFGGSNGITIFRPDEITKSSLPPKVFLTDFKLLNKSIIPGDRSLMKKPVYEMQEILVPFHQNNITLEFLAIHYSNPQKNKYAYKMENYDNDWRNVGNQPVAFYPNLPPGKYIFRVKAANNNGVWNEKGASLGIIVEPPWWKTRSAYIAFALIIVSVSFGLDRYFRHRIVQKERAKNQARELQQAKEIEKAYKELKSTQSQLIQSEKMASLGELTAGIAHEIQNPLNFVNNFSEVNLELIGELKTGIENGQLNEAITIVEDITLNEQKINFHGKRADAIVKGMLQHSRISNGIKEPTDINSLADEYLRLSYHGLRAKDKSFNSDFKIEPDQNLPNVNVIPQDIGRVLLNLINNAFYAVSERKRMQSDGYKPEVALTTRNMGNHIEIRVKDNGNGIPKNVLDKIFQPFFTTKPAGEGTGLGLSLSYDIIKAHGGELKVETREGEGTEFIIVLNST